MAKEKFVIITPGRSGSTHLCETLNTGKYIHIHEELFNRAKNDSNTFNAFIHHNRWYKVLGYFFNREKTSRFKVNFVLTYIINQYIHHCVNNCKEVFGFKLTLDQLHAYPQLLSILKKHQFKVIYLSRKDKLKLVLSLIKARKTGVYQSVDDNNNIVNPEVFDSKLVAEKFMEITKWENELMNNLKAYNYQKIHYEELFADYDSTLHKILLFLDLASIQVKRSNLKKLNSDDLKSWVRNLKEINQKINLLKKSKNLV